MNLAATQRAFLDDVTGVAPRDAAAREREFRRPPRGTVEDRWRIYETGYLARLVEALSDDYPAVARILGDAAFRSLTARYVAQNRPRSYDLGRAGARLAEFLDGDPLRDDLPFLPDLARFEWSLAECFIAADEPPVTWDALARSGAEALATTPLRLRAGTRLIRSDWPLVDLWRTRDADDADVDVEVTGRPSTIAVVRRGETARPVDLDHAAFSLAEVASRGESLADWCDAVASAAEIESGVAALRRLVAEQMLSSRTAPDGPASAHHTEE